MTPSFCSSYQIRQQLAWCTSQARKELIIEEAAGAGGVEWRVISQVCFNVFQTHFHTYPLSNFQVRRHPEQTSHEERLPTFLDIPITSDNKQTLVTLIVSTLRFFSFFFCLFCFDLLIVCLIFFHLQALFLSFPFWFIVCLPDFYFYFLFLCLCSWLINVGIVEMV